MKYHEPLLHRADARVKSIVHESPFILIELDDTIFYPGGGGQPNDTGFIRNKEFEAEVIEVFKQDEQILHKARLLKGELNIGDVIEQELNINRREGLVKMHTGEHMLFGALQKIVKDIALDKIALDVEESSIFVKCKELTWKELFQAESLVNKVINDARKVLVQQITKEEASLLPGLRIKIDRIKDDKIRVVEIEGFDLSACNGVHAINTSFVGNLLITRLNQAKGIYEIRFKVDVKQELFDYARQLREISSITGADIKQLIPVISKLIKENENLKKKYRELAKEALNELKEENIKGIEFLYNSFEEMEKKQLVDKANESIKPKTIIFLMNKLGEKCDLILITSPDLKINAPEMLRKVMERFGGKGGGRDNVAMGSVPAGHENELLEKIRAEIISA